MSISLDKNHLQENVWWKLITRFVYQNTHLKLAVPLIFIVYLTYFQNAAVSFECFWKSFSWQGSFYEKCVIEQVSHLVTKSLHVAFSFCTSSVWVKFKMSHFYASNFYGLKMWSQFSGSCWNSERRNFLWRRRELQFQNTKYWGSHATCISQLHKFTVRY